MKNQIWKRILISLVGLILCGIGVAMFLYSGMGVDPASVFELGIGRVSGISYGTSSALINVIILLIVFFIDKSFINISSVIAIFGIGYTADFVRKILTILVQGEIHLFLKLVLILVGLFIMSCGIATYIKADLGVGAIDLISEIISRKTKVQYRLVRVIGDTAFVVIGYFLGGTVGVGTVVAAFLTGPTVQLVRPGIERILEIFLKGKEETL
ncbi:membrane protein [Oribacterium parvum]|uniref:YczE/YyaS/YitT family protein n=1 Tax=Oribacterium parvum TaxID=1501329 RepID=UPI0028DC464A|nr:membrane protein [Oribacterium parvum]